MLSNLFSRRVAVLGAAVAAILTLPAVASADFAIDWSNDLGLPIGSALEFTPGQSLVLTGTTVGSQILPYTATLNFISSTPTDRFLAARVTQGGISGSLGFSMGNGAGTRSLGQRITLDISVTGAPNLVATRFLLTDIDTFTNGTEWRDQVEVFTPGATLTVQNIGVAGVSGQVVTAFESLVGNTFPDGNVNVSFVPGTSSLSLEYRNAPNSPLDGTTQNIAVTDVVFVTVPEGGTLGLMGMASFGAALPILAARRRRLRASA